MANIGEVKPKGTMYFRQAQGEALDDCDNVIYEMSTNIAGGQPILRSAKTGKWFTISWNEIIALAVERGIDEP